MTKTPKVKKPTAAEIAALVTPERVEAAAKSGAIARLLRLSKAFTRASNARPYALDLPILCPVTIEDHGIRQKNIASGVELYAHAVTLGKKGGLIFHFKPKGPLKCDRGNIIHVEMTWSDVDSVLGDLTDQITVYLGADAAPFIEDLQADLTRAVKANFSMHAILSSGFDAAQKADTIDEKENQLQKIPGYGSF